MIKQIICDNWKMHLSGSDKFYDARVPGTVCSDLLAAGAIEDPYYRDNETKTLKLLYNDFEYRTVFQVSDEIRKSEKVLLHFDGLDTIADIYLNNVFVGNAYNMHREWEFSVKEILQAGDNDLRIFFHSPVKYIEEEYRINPIEGTSDAMRGFPSIRKAHCMFGWDWGIRLPDSGIWRDAYLVGYSAARIDNVYITQKHGKNEVDLGIQVEAELSSGEKSTVAPEENDSGLWFQTTLRDPDGKVVADKVKDGRIHVDAPRLWWPNGYGEQALYTIKVELIRQGVVLDVWEKRIGLRTLKVSIEKDEFGTSFAHQVNGIKFFAMGADYIPEDALLSRISRERTYHLLMQAKQANFNCIRVWGGGHYPDDSFWDACDELGLVVWQDFMFACAVYDLTDEFEDNIVHEFIDNVKRIRHHASLGLWGGNNEMEQFVADGVWVTKPKQKSDYVKMYEYIIPKVLKKYDPNTFYWPASPSSGGAFDNPNDESRGDTHYWEVWHANKPFTEYRHHFFRYLSEFGFQSFPLEKTCESFTLPKDRNIFSYVMEKHQRNQAANGKIIGYMEQMYLYPENFQKIVYASQLLQAQAIRYGVEHLRRNRGRCMGTVIWQLNDCWPVASWSSIDYYGRWKALHYHAKRFFAPLLLSCEEEGILTQDSNPNAQPYDVKKSVRFNVCNESLNKHKVTVRWQLKNVKGDVKAQFEKELDISPLSAVWMDRVELPEAELGTDYVVYELTENQKRISKETLIFCEPKNFQFQDPKLQLHVDGNKITIQSSAYARDIEILNENEDMVLEDNYFDLEPGEEKTVRIIEGIPKGLKIRSVYDIL
ncbi:beta-mannosidase [Porcincola intestinalis]